MIEVEIIDPAHIIGMDLARTVRRGLKSKAEWLMEQESQRIYERTPQWVPDGVPAMGVDGNLAKDERGTCNTDTDDDELVHLFVDPGGANQRKTVSFVNGDPGNRIYAEAVEFGSPANRFNPMGGYHMYGSAEAEDIPVFEQFAMMGLEVGIADIVSGNGLRL